MNQGKDFAITSFKTRAETYSPSLNKKPKRRRLPFGPVPLGLFVLIGLVILGKQADCSQLQRRQSHDEQQYLEQSSLLPGGFGRDFSNLIDESGIMEVPSKRARKMTAFMPMRGRKDGRDQLENLELAYLSELGDSEPSILHLVKEAARNQVGNAQTRLFHWPGNYYYSQMIGKNVAPESQSSSSQVGSPALTNGNGAHLRIGNSRAGNFREEENGQFGIEQPALMQAKLRRAFHPMRGKKSGGLAVQAPEMMLSPEQSAFADSDLTQILLSSEGS